MSSRVGAAAGEPPPELVDLLDRSVSGLQPRLGRVITLRLGLNGEEPQTLQQIGDGYRLSRERIRQLERKAVGILSARARRRQVPDVQPSPEAQLRALLADLLKPSEDGYADRALALAEVIFARRGFLTGAATLLSLAGSKRSEIRRAIPPAATRARKALVGLRTRTDETFNRRIGRFVAWPPKLRDERAPLRRGRAREVGDGDGWSIPGEFVSKKLNRLVACESRAELAFYLMLEASDSVKYYQEQPFVVPYIFNGQDYHYYPDVLFALRDGRCVLAEIKPRSRFGLMRDLVKWSALWKFCKQGGYGLYIGDGRESFQSIVQRRPPAAFETLLLNELRRGPVNWSRYLQLASTTGTGSGRLASLVLRHRLDWQLRPFQLRETATAADTLDDLYAALGSATGDYEVPRQEA